MTIRVTCPSQASQRARAAEMVAPKPSSAAPRPVPGSARSSRSIFHDDLRLVATQRRQPTGGQGVVGQLHQRVGPLLGPCPVVAGGAAGLQQRLQRRLQLLPAHGIEVEPAGERPVGVLDDCQPSPLCRIGLRPVLVQPVQVVLHGLGGVHVRACLGHAGQQLVDHAEVDALLGGAGEGLGLGDPGDDRGLPAGDLTRGERRGHGR
jgi:hypothetical protein